MVQTLLKLTRKIVVPFLLSCLFLGVLGFGVTLIIAFDNYKQDLVFNDIEHTRNLLHKAYDYATLYTTKSLAVEEMYSHALIRSPEGHEVVRLFEDNLNTNLKKSVELTTEAKNTNPRVWSKLTELLDKRLSEKLKLVDIEEDYIAKMRLYEQQEMSDEEWNNYSQKTYPALIDEWNQLSQNNTQFNIDNKIELNPPYEELDNIAISKYKPTLTGLFKDFWGGNPEVTESYEDTEPYPIITYLSDDHGNETKLSEYNKYSGIETFNNNDFPTPLKVGDYIFIGVGTQDLVERKMFYKFSSNSGMFNKYYSEKRPENEGFTEKGYFLYKVQEQDNNSTDGKLKIEVIIKSDGDTHRLKQEGIDDRISGTYPIQL
ncbi:hypothetical protein C4561_00780 [candidate division WWE3 bacterium]|jgi:hypothetical protein|uniref:Uncharacterized protein n=1 Tax=candidate division WWE3 bacterium TaxID=2053526 RepID=A0A3A4ZFU3_UNCKA|nr:MAG: hypothetical protein C4561_00780 [candidate division WWE3 bacterium]